MRQPFFIKYKIKPVIIEFNKVFIKYKLSSNELKAL